MAAPRAYGLVALVSEGGFTRMQCCTDCGHSNRSGVHFCTHCGKAISGSAVARPTAVVAAMVLAVGLVAFLTIRPVAQPRDSAEAPASTLAVQEPASTPDIEVADAAEATNPLEAAMQSGGDSTGAVATPGLDPSLADRDAIAAPSSELMVPAVSSAGSSLELQAALALAEPAAAHDPVGAPDPHAPRPHAQLPPPATPAARRAALDSVPARSAAASPRPIARQSWLASLRAEIEACEGNLIVRTVCAESAKMRRCTSASAWGKVPECPAARLPNLATFN